MSLLSSVKVFEARFLSYIAVGLIASLSLLSLASLLEWPKEPEWRLRLESFEWVRRGCRALSSSF